MSSSFVLALTIAVPTGAKIWYTEKTPRHIYEKVRSKKHTSLGGTWWQPWHVGSQKSEQWYDSSHRPRSIRVHRSRAEDHSFRGFATRECITQRKTPPNGSDENMSEGTCPNLDRAVHRIGCRPRRLDAQHCFHHESKGGYCNLLPVCAYPFSAEHARSHTGCWLLAAGTLLHQMPPEIATNARTLMRPKKLPHQPSNSRHGAAPMAHPAAEHSLPWAASRARLAISPTPCLWKAYMGYVAWA